MLFTISLLIIISAIWVIIYFIKIIYMDIKDNQQPPVSSLSQQKRSFTERHSSTIKMVVVGTLTLLLLIPLGMIRSLIYERQNTKNSAVSDITSKWGGEQTITGPCLVVPYSETVLEDKKEVQVTRNLLILPEVLNVNSSVSVEKRKRGIYDASVYNSDVMLSGEFDMAAINIPKANIKWNDMQMIIGLSDLKGITEKVTLKSNEKIISFESGLPVDNLASGSGVTSMEVVSDKASVAYDYGAKTYDLFTVGLNAKLDSIGPDTLMQEKLPFNISLKMNGSQGLYVVPIGKTTTLKMQSNWTTPSFDGEFLPANHDITNNGFTSDWKVLDLNRSYGQVFRADNTSAMNLMASSRFGVRFIQSVDQYQQNLRSVKYAILIILLTFVVVFFIEMLQKKSVNPLQYLLVGLALVLFYSLLLSMSEVWGFNLAYAVAATMTTILIILHLSSILKNRKQGLLIGALLAFLYVFVFILIQMESFALLVGSLGLFAILAIIMFYSKKIQFS